MNRILGGIYSFKIKIKDILTKYDYETLNGPLTFTELLKEILQNSSNTIRLIVSCCKYKLVDAKTKKESLIYSSMSAEETAEFDMIKLMSALKLKELEKQQKKVERPSKKLELYEDTMRDIEELINNSSVSKLYRIAKLTVEFIPDSDRQEIASYATILAKAISTKEQLKDNTLVANIERRLRRRAMREYLANWKQELIGVYRSNPDELVVPTKR